MLSTTDEKIESLKQKLNASNIIKDDVFNTSLYSQKNIYPKASYAAMGRSNLTFKESVRLDELRSRVERELTNGLSLDSDKKELQLLIADQLELQARLKAEYGKQLEQLRAGLENLGHHTEDQEKIYMERNERTMTKIEENSALEGETNDLQEENRLIEAELKRLADKTTSKMKEMQTRMQTNLSELENLKKRHEEDHSKLRQISTDKIRRMEDDFKNKLTSLSDKLNETLSEKQTIESDLQRLQDAKKRGESELETKIRAMREQFFEDAFNQSKGVIKILHNRHKNSIDNKDALLKKQTILANDAQSLEQRVQEEEIALIEENSLFTENVKALREDIFSAQKELESLKTLNYNTDGEHQRISNDIQRERHNFKQILDSGKFKVKEHVDRYRSGIETSKTKINQQKNRVKELEDELLALRSKYALEVSVNEKQIQSMKTQLGRNITGTLNEYKEYGSSKIPRDEYLHRERNLQNNYSNY